MIEKIILDYLNEKLKTPCYMEEPEECSGSFVVIEKTGGSSKEHIKHAVFAIKSYGNTLLDAAELNSRVVNTMAGFIQLDEICKVTSNEGYNFTDTTKKRYRYQAVFDITHY